MMSAGVRSPPPPDEHLQHRARNGNPVPGLVFGLLVLAMVVGSGVAGVSLLVAATIGFVFMTWLRSRFARVSAAVLSIVLLFFGWLWGVWGLLLGR